MLRAINHVFVAAAAAEAETDAWDALIGAAALLAVALAATAVIRAGARALRDSSEATEFASRAAESYAAVQETLPEPAPSLEDEIAEVSGTLATTVSRLRNISEKAQAFETEVKALVQQADAAQAAARLSEDDARKISMLLGSQTEQKLKEEIAKLTTVHNEQMEKLRKSGTRVAVWTFVAGAVVGFLGNLLSTALMT